MTSSPSKTILLKVTFAVGCLVSLFFPKSLPHISPGSPPRQLYASSLYNDPRTVQLRSSITSPGDPDAAGTIISNVSERPQTNVGASPAWWEDINYELNLCGKSKCYFPRISDPAKGYLVWDCPHQGIWNRAIGAYDYAAMLESKYNIRHFLLSPPYKSDTPEYFREHLTDEEVKKYLGAGPLIIQENLNAPKGSIVFKCKAKSLRHPDLDFAPLDYMIAHGNKDYEHVLLEEFSHTSQLLEYEPQLAVDFQFMMDLDGRIYHLDLDRVIRNKPAKRRPGHHTGHHTAGRLGGGNLQNCLEDAANYIRSSMKES